MRYNNILFRSSAPSMFVPLLRSSSKRRGSRLGIPVFHSTIPFHRSIPPNPDAHVGLGMRRTRLSRIQFKCLQTFKRLGFLDSLLYFWSGLLSIKYPSAARTTRQSQVRKSAKPRFRHRLLLLLLLQTTYSSTGRS